MCMYSFSIDMNSSGNVSIHIVESELSTIQITQMGTFEGIAIAVGIGIVAAIGLVIRGAFIYYIKYKAPKKRHHTLNLTRVCGLFKVFQFLLNRIFILLLPNSIHTRVYASIIILNLSIFTVK